MKLEVLSRDDWVLAGVGLLLVIDLLFLAWFTVSFDGFSASSTATGSPDGWLGVLAVLTTVAVVADLAIERFSPATNLPAIAGRRTETRFVLACVTAALIALKFVLHVHFSLFGFGFYAAVVLVVVFVYIALRARTGSTLQAGTP